MSSPLIINPANGKIYRHPVILPNGNLDELWEAQKKRIPGYRRYWELERSIQSYLSAVPELRNHQYEDDKSAIQEVIDYLLLPKKTIRNVEKYKSFNLEELLNAPLTTWTSKGEVKFDGDLTALFISCEKPCIMDVINHLWHHLEFDFGTPNWEAPVSTFLEITYEVYSRFDGDLELEIPNKLLPYWGKLCTPRLMVLFLETTKDPYSFLDMSTHGFCWGAFKEVLKTSEIYNDQKLKILQKMFELGPLFSFVEHGDELVKLVIRHIDDPSSGFSFIPDDFKKFFSLSKDTLQAILDRRDPFFETVHLLGKVLRKFQVDQAVLLELFEKKASEIEALKLLAQSFSDSS